MAQESEAASTQLPPAQVADMRKISSGGPGLGGLYFCQPTHHDHLTFPFVGGECTDGDGISGAVFHLYRKTRLLGQAEFQLFIGVMFIVSGRLFHRGVGLAPSSRKLPGSDL